MGIIHFLNVKDGDCAWIQHPSGHNTIIDISNGNDDSEAIGLFSSDSLREGVRGNFQQKKHPVNPIEYLLDYNVTNIFRFILTHPDMDHMDGIENLFTKFEVLNFWDTDNNKTMGTKSNCSKYKESDWEFYQKVRQRKESPTVFNLLSGDTGQYFNLDKSGKPDADGLYILAPTRELVEDANNSGKYNDASYVILYRTRKNKRILFSGDSAEKTWDYILKNYKKVVTNIDVLLAPHHGRKTGGNDDYLDVLKPKLTLFGNAESKYLDYASWNNRDLPKITNNQAGSIILDTDVNGSIYVYVTNESFAEKIEDSFYEKKYNAWYIGSI